MDKNQENSESTPIIDENEDFKDEPITKNPFLKRLKSIDIYHPHKDKSPRINKEKLHLELKEKSEEKQIDEGNENSHIKFGDINTSSPIKKSSPNLLIQPKKSNLKQDETIILPLSFTSEEFETHWKKNYSENDKFYEAWNFLQVFFFFNKI